MADPTQLPVVCALPGMERARVPDDSPRSREIIARMLGFLRRHLAGPPAP